MTIYSFKPVRVVVVDAETNSPIPQADVKVWYGDDTHLRNPAGEHVVTDRNGVAVVNVGARLGGIESLAYWSVWASDYAGEGGFAQNGLEFLTVFENERSMNRMAG